MILFKAKPEGLSMYSDVTERERNLILREMEELADQAELTRADRERYDALDDRLEALERLERWSRARSLL